MENFFKPFIGYNYSTGYNGVKTLVLGASLYCNKTCEHREECTKDSKPFENCCPHAVGQKLSDNIINEIENYLEKAGRYNSYDNFTKLINHSLDTTTKEIRKNIWNQFAFYDYIQHFLAEKNTPRFKANKRLYKSDFPAFEKVRKELKPEFIIIWGQPVFQVLKESYGDKFEKIDPYNEYHYKLTEESGTCYFCYLNHPSYPGFNCLIEDNYKALLKAIDYVKQEREEWITKLNDN